MTTASRCRSCHAEVVWAVTSAGKRMPVDPQPTDDGNMILTEDDPPQALVVPTGQAALFAVGTGAHRFTSHFVTCPDADQHRRPR